MTRLVLLCFLLGACVVDIETIDDETYEAEGKADGGGTSAPPAGRLVLSHATRGEMSLGDAEWLAYVSELAYLSPEGFTARIRAVEPAARVSWYSQLTAIVYYVELPTAGILVFRGTNGWGDWFLNVNTDARNTWLGVMHKGFWGHLEEVWSEPLKRGGDAKNFSLRDLLAAKHSPDRGFFPLYVTGHSLGGALASITYARLELDGCRNLRSLPADPLACARLDGRDDGAWIPVHALYTFGAPRFGTNPVGELVGSPLVSGIGTPVYRFVNRGDIVTRIPDDLRYSHPRSGAAGESAFIVHLGTNGITRGRIDGTYNASADDHQIGRYVRGIRERRSR